MTNTEQPIPDTAEAFETENEVEARAHIFRRASKRREKLIPVEEWGRDGKPMMVLIRALSGDQRSAYFAFSASLSEQKGQPDFYRKLMFEQVRLGCLHPKTGKPLFQIADQDALMSEEDGAVIELLAAMVREISHLDRSAVETAKKKLHLTQNAIDTTNSANDSTANA